MNSTKIFKVLSKFSVVELNRFNKFVKSPYFNINEELVQFAGLIIELIKKDVEESKEIIYYNVYGEKKFNDQRFRTLSTKLLNLVEEFIAVHEFSLDKHIRDEFLLKGIRRKKLTTLDKKSSENARRSLERSLQQSSDQFLYEYKFELNLYKRINEFEKKSISGDPLESSNIFDVNYPLDKFYFLSKLRYINELITYNYMYKLNIELGEFDLIEKMIMEKDLLKVPAINTYYLLCKALMEPAEEKFYKALRKTQYDNLEIFNAIEKREIFNSTLNYVISKANKGNKEYYNEILSLYEMGIESEVLLLEKKLSATSFRNIVFAAIRINKYDYAKKFVENNADLLSKDDRLNAVNFSLARIAMNEKDWRKAIEYIAVIDFEDSNYNLSSRLMMLNAYYELKEFGPLESLMDSFSVFLRRKKFVNEVIMISYQNHLKFLRKLIKLFNPEKSKVEALRKEIEDSERVINKVWLLQKLDEI